MKRFLIYDISDVTELMYREVQSGCSDVSFIGLYDDAVKVIKELMFYDGVYPYQILIEPEEWDGYDKEYLVTLDSDLCVWCEKVCREHGYIEIETDCALIADDCSSVLLKKIFCDDEKMYEVSYDLDYEEESNCECDGNCECCCFAKNDDEHEVVTRVTTDKNGKVMGFEKAWDTKDGNMNYHTTYSFYSNNENMLKDLLKDFNIKL